MRYEIEKRLHRVKITLDRNGKNCPDARNCNKATNCDRGINYYKKCSLYNRWREYYEFKARNKIF